VSKIGNIWKTVLAGGAGVAALVAVNASIKRRATDPDNSALGGDAHFYDWKHGRVFYKTAGQQNSGLPLLFVHGVGAGVSSFMWRKNFDDLSSSFRVYAPDLLGFGLSDKPATAAYSADLTSSFSRISSVGFAVRPSISLPVRWGALTQSGWQTSIQNS